MHTEEKASWYIVGFTSESMCKEFLTLNVVVCTLTSSILKSFQDSFEGFLPFVGEVILRNTMVPSTALHVYSKPFESHKGDYSTGTLGTCLGAPELIRVAALWSSCAYWLRGKAPLCQLLG